MISTIAAAAWILAAYVSACWLIAQVVGFNALDDES